MSVFVCVRATLHAQRSTSQAWESKFSWIRHINVCRIGYRHARKQTLCDRSNRANRNTISSRSRMAWHLQSGIVMHRRFNNSKGHFFSEAIADIEYSLHCLLTWYLLEVPERLPLCRIKSLTQHHC